MQPIERCTTAFRLPLAFALLALVLATFASSQVVLTSADSSHQRDLKTCSPLIGRREWRTMSREERASWIASVKCLVSVNHQRLSFTLQGTAIDGTHSLYDDFAFAHVQMEENAHRNSYFLPWHRWFVYLFDTKLRDTCGYNGPTPFWDWSLDVADLFASPVFDPDPVSGLGGSGDCISFPESDCLVLDGAFAPYSDHTNTFTPLLAFPTPHTLRRNLSLYSGEIPHERPRNATITPARIETAMQRTTPGDFLKFQHAIEHMHDRVHNFIGGDLAGTCPRAFKEVMGVNCSHAFTPNEPLFWLHHTQLDRLWSKWQNRHPENFHAFIDPNASITSILRFDRLSVEVPVDKVFDHSAPPLCYHYEPSEEEGRK